MKWNKILFILLLASFMVTCESPIKKQNNVSQINLNIDFSEITIDTDAISKVNDIRIITVVVDGDDMDRIVKDFNVSGNRVVCELEVPKGDARFFKVQGKDTNGIVQFSGQKMANVQNSEVEVLINELTIFAPPSVDFGFRNVTEIEFDIQWSKSNAPDFSHYRILISRNPSLNLENNKIGDDIFDINQNLMNISSAEPATDYFVAVVVFDTEGYFTGSLTFGDENSIVRKVRTLEPLTLIEPVNVEINDILSDSFVLRWSKSTPENFGFYRVLLSQNQVLDANNHQIGNDFNDVNRNFLFINELEPNTIYYTAVIAASTGMDYQGSLVFGAENSIVHEVITANQFLVYVDDETYEEFLFLENPGHRFFNVFYQPAPMTYLREVWLYLWDDSGVNGNYRVVVLDKNRNEIFYSNPLPTKNGTDWVGWQIPWENFADGYIDEYFYIGIEYTKESKWPKLGLDQNSDNGHSYYVKPDGTVYTLADVGFPGNFGIQVVVDASGTFGGTENDNTEMTLTPLTRNGMKISTQSPGKAQNNIIMVDKRQSYKNNDNSIKRAD